MSRMSEATTPTHPVCPLRPEEACSVCVPGATGPQDCLLAYLVMADPTLRERLHQSVLTRLTLRLMHHDATHIRGELQRSGPERIDLGLLGVGGPDFLYPTPDHKDYLATGRVQRHPGLLARCTMDGDDILLADGDVHELSLIHISEPTRQAEI